MLSGERFAATYRLRCSPEEAEARARAIAVEQTIEFPAELVRDAAIRDQIIGQVAEIRLLGPQQVEVVIEYAVECAGRELTQLLNVLFGNVSIQPGVRLVDVALSPTLAALYPGPRVGQAGLRERLGVWDRPLLCTAIKPMGLSPESLAELAYQLARGGMDLIKDDHGLADQPFCPFAERVARCAEAVARANAETGGDALYLPNVTAPTGVSQERAHLAKAAGAGGVLFAPGLGGFDMLRALSQDDALDLPILAHPALLGSFTAHPDHGLSHRVLYGQLMRLAGADASIFPSWGGRFAFTRDECLDLVAGATEPLAGLKPIFPTPGGGMRLDRVGELLEVYGRDCILLIGGDLHQGGRLVENCARFREAVER